MSNPYEEYENKALDELFLSDRYKRYHLTPLFCRMAYNYENPFLDKLSEDFVKSVLEKLKKDEDYQNLGSWVQSFITKPYMQDYVLEDERLFASIFRAPESDRAKDKKAVGELFDKWIEKASFSGVLPPEVLFVYSEEEKARGWDFDSTNFSFILTSFRKYLSPVTINTIVRTAIHTHDFSNESYYFSHSLFLEKSLTSEILIYALERIPPTQIWSLNKIAFHRHTPLYILEELKSHPSAKVRSAVAKNPNSPLSLLTELSLDKVKSVRNQAEENLKKLTIK